MSFYSLKIIIYVNVPFSEKNEAKRLGARWNPGEKLWYFEFLWDDFWEFIDDIRYSHTYKYKPIKADANLQHQSFDDVDYGDIDLDNKDRNDPTYDTDLDYIILKNNEKVCELAKNKYARYMTKIKNESAIIEVKPIIKLKSIKKLKKYIDTL